ncbi:hypothetical protein HFN86_35710 [Rhizobium laguerreae]|uniref:condensation domain-containing protein n=1 Tax=Rhizobium laguerreae TaxID=1076926 RepID=UPI001C9042C8|nr:condensation domain-containing protein [Rhizobium laguerreae]MBY3425461.1 hypothetical protein [Rhizobium laguerreae]
MSEPNLRTDLLSDIRQAYCLPLSFTQECLFENIPQEAIEDHLNTVTAIIQMQRSYDRGALRTAVELLMKRHNALRFTLLRVGGRVIVNQITRIDPTDVIETVDATAANQAMANSFRLYDSPLVRFIVYIESAESWILTIQMHHCISDGRSMEIIRAEFQEIYANVVTGGDLGNTVPMQFDEHIRSLHSRFANGLLDDDLLYWKELIHRCQGDGPVVSSTRLGLMHVRLHAIEADLHQTILATARKMRVSVFSYFAHSFLKSLQELVAAPCSFETTFSGRWTEELENCVGYFSHNAVVATDFLHERTRQAQLVSLSSQIFDSLSAQQIPMHYLLIKKYVHPEDNYPSRRFRIKLQMQNYQRSSPAGYLPLVSEPVIKTEMYTSRAIRLFLIPFNDGILLRVEYRSDFFSDLDLAQLLNRTLAALRVPY